MYTGGAGGEFLCHWLNLNSTGQNLHTRFLPNNRFILPKVYRSSCQVDNNGSDQPVFYPRHPADVDSQLIEYINNGLANLFVIKNNVQHYCYYFFLFLIKTIFYKNYNFTLHFTIPKIQSLPAPYNCPDKLSETVGRSWHYNYELDNYIDQRQIPTFQQAVPEIIDSRINNGSLSSPMSLKTVSRTYNKFHVIDANELYFSNTQQVCNNICAYANVQPTQSINAVKIYVRENIKLVEKYSGLSFDAFLNTDNESIKYLLYNMLEKHHNEEYQNTP